MGILKNIRGDRAVNAAVEEFYNRVYSDPRLAPMFKGADRKKTHKKATCFSWRSPEGRGRGGRGVHA